MLTAVQAQDPLPSSPDDDSLDFTEMDKWAVAPRGRLRPANLNLPDSFEDFNAKKFIEVAYGLATQI